MNIINGRKYVLRNGDVVGPITRSESIATFCMKFGTHYWDERGFEFGPEYISEFDIVSEYDGD